VKVVAIGYGISSLGREIIEAIANNVLEQGIEIIDVKSMAAEVSSTDIVLLFGKKAASFFTGGAREEILLPDLKKLEPGNDKEREQTYTSLLALKDKLNNQTTLTIDNLSDFTCNKIQSLEQILIAKNTTSWKGKLKDGRSIELSITPKKKETEISLTFAELYSIRLAMDTLGVDEVVIN
jgi:hypothetical protein